MNGLRSRERRLASQARLVRAIWCVLTCGLAFAPAAFASVTADGYVTAVRSKRAFELGKIRVTLTRDAKCALVIRQRPRYYDPILDPRSRHLPVAASIPCDRLDLAFGSRIQAIGTRGPSMTFKVSSLTLFRELPVSPSSSSTILEEQPHLQKTSNGWSGALWLDGFPVTVTPHTRMLAAPPGTGLQYGGGRRGMQIIHTRLSRLASSFPFDPLLAKAGNAVTYHLRAEAGGEVSATQLRFWQIKRSLREQQFWKKLSIAIRTPPQGSYAPAPRPLLFRKGIYALPDPSVQNWVSALGSSLIPEYQKTLPDADNEKVQFRFYVTERIMLRNLEPFGPSQSVIFNFTPVVALPDGTILIPDRVLPRLRSRAQLAALLAFAETQVLQKQSFIYWRYLKCCGDSETLSPSYFRFDNRMLRIGIRQLYLAGYDIRVAPIVWTLASGKATENPVYDASSLSLQQRMQAIPRYTAYAYQFIHEYYSGVDVSRLKRGRAEYAVFLKDLRQADPQAFVDEK